MSRRPASCFWKPFVAGLAALALAGCGGGAHEAPAAQPVAASKPADNPEPAPTAVPAPAATVDAPAVAANTTAPAASPAAAPETAPQDAVPPAPAPAPDPNAKPVDALQRMQDGEARRADYQRRLKESEADLAVANASVADWARTVLEFKNPFLPRPKLSPEDARAIEGMDGGARLHWAEGRLADAVTARDAAQKSFDDLKASPPTN